jgi:mannan polymerase II complex MNN10 subunit
MREMLKPENERLEWIQWVDRDTLILDQCRPISSFLPPEQSRLDSLWRHDNSTQYNANTTNLLVNTDVNGLNDGVFLLRVNSWAIDLFTAILAFRYYNPKVKLPYTEQSAMEYVIGTSQFRNQTRYVPQHWFNGYQLGGPVFFETREDADGMDAEYVRRGDYMVHFAGQGMRDEGLIESSEMLERQEDIWKERRVLRDVSGEVENFWRSLGVGR